MQRWDVINYIAGQRELKSYLEIGCGTDDTFNRVESLDKVGVDPISGGTMRLTSDEFFAHNVRQWDLVFIDGLHTFGQSLADVCNSLSVVTSRGAIVVHDCLPTTEVEQMPTQSEVNAHAWTGEVWKTFAIVRSWPHVDSVVLDCDWGVGVILPRLNGSPLRVVPPLTWDTYAEKSRDILRVVDEAGLREFIGD